jgi:LysR family hydrogen peroxide-inducible transcriptional activator
MSVPLFDEQLWSCAAPDDPMSASSAPLSLSALKDRELLSLGPGHRLSQLISELARKAGGRVSEEYHGTSLDATRQMAIMGTGVAILPSLYVKREAQRDRDITLRPIDHKLARRTISLIWRKGSPLTKRFEEIAATMENVAGDLLQ